MSGNKKMLKQTRIVPAKYKELNVRIKIVK